MFFDFIINDNLILIGCDLTKIDQLHNRFVTAGIDFNWPTLLVGECSLTYLDVRHADHLLKYMSDRFTSLTLLLYEQICPDDGFGHFMLNHFASIGSPLQCIAQYPSLQSLDDRFIRLGFTQRSICDMNHIYSNVLSDKERIRIESLESFDEFEAFHLKCGHYALSICTNNSSRVQSEIWRQFSMSIPRSIVNSQKRIKCHSIYSSTTIHRYGHRAVISANGCRILLSGGVGRDNHGRHGFIESIVVIQLNTENEENVVIDSMQLARCYHQMYLLHDGRYLLIVGGRRSPKRASDISVILMIDCIDWKLQSIDVDPMISSRWRLAGCAISTRSVMVCGGRTNDKVLTDTYLLTIEDDGHLVCQQLADLPIALHSHSCVFDAVHQRVLLTGGLINWHCTSSTIYEYDIQLGIWRRLADLDDTARYGHTSHLIDNRLLIVGGSRPDHGATDAARSVVIIQMDTTITTTVLMIDDQHRNCLVNHDSALLTGSHRLVTIGGGGNFFSFGTFFNGTISSFDISQVDNET